MNVHIVERPDPKGLYKAIATGNINNELFREKTLFKLQITLDRHNARQNLNDCVLPRPPPHFSLPSTFKGTGSRDRIQLYGQKGIVSGINKSLFLFLNF